MPERNLGRRKIEANKIYIPITVPIIGKGGEYLGIMRMGNLYDTPQDKKSKKNKNS